MTEAIGTPIWKLELALRAAEWEDKLRIVSPKEWRHAHLVRTVEILSGEPPTQALLDCAYDWQYAYFGGAVTRRYRFTDEGGQEHKMVDVKVYTD